MNSTRFTSGSARSWRETTIDGRAAGAVRSGMQRLRLKSKTTKPNPERLHEAREVLAEKGLLEVLDRGERVSVSLCISGGSTYQAYGIDAAGGVLVEGYDFPLNAHDICPA